MVCWQRHTFLMRVGILCHQTFISLFIGFTVNVLPTHIVLIASENYPSLTWWPTIFISSHRLFPLNMLWLSS
jgi:hypothetical protein